MAKPKLNGVTAVIVAAGRGSRLSPHTDKTPKCMLAFAGRTLLEWQCAALRAAGVEDIGVVTGYLADRVVTTGLRKWHNPKWDSTNMVTSLLAARTALRSGNDIIICYGDIVIEPRLIETLLNTPDDIATVVDRNWLALWQARAEDPLADAESLSIDAVGHITDIGRKVDRVETIEAQYIGLTRLTVSGMGRFLDFHASLNDGDQCLEGRPVQQSYMTDILRGMIEAGMPIAAAAVAGGWIEFDTTADLELYTRLLQEGRLDKFFRLPGEATPW